MRGFSFIFPINVQSASPLYIWHLVRPCTVNALMPVSCSLSASSTIIFESSSHPSRVFTVTGLRTASTMLFVIITILSGSRIIPEPAPLPAILLTGHPKFMSMTSHPCPPAIWSALSAILAASTIASGLFPYIWIPIGASSSDVFILAIALAASRISPSDGTNSV